MENLKKEVYSVKNSVQNEFKKGKEKLQNSKEVSALISEVSQSEKERSKLMLEVGEIAYNKIRRGEISLDDFEKHLEEIKEIDKSIFNGLKVLDYKTREDEGFTCKCGEKLTLDTKFCGVCGLEVTKESQHEHLDNIACKSCGEDVLSNSKFCSCCGFNIS